MSDPVGEFKARIRAEVGGPLGDALARLRAAEESRTWRDGLRCALRLHKPAISAVHDGGPVQRCSCGAVRFGPRAPWMSGDPFGRRAKAVGKAMERAVKQIEETG